MLRHLRMGNLALAADVALELRPGLTMLTGETGAGKSLVAGALELLAGGKADRGQIRQGEELAFVEGVFELDERSDQAAAVRRAGVALADDGVLVLRRELRREGRGRVVVNGMVSSLAVLQELGGRLVAVQSQDQQRELGRATFAVDFLDAVLGLADLRDAVAAARRRWHERRDRLAARRREEAFAGEQLAMWEYQHRELEAAALDPEEEARLREQLALGRDARGLLEAAAAAHAELADGEPNAVALLGAAAARLAAPADASARLAAVLDGLVTAQDQAAEAARELERFLATVEVDPARLDELEERHALYAELARKYDRDTAGLLALQADLAGRIARHRAADRDLDELQAACGAAEDELAAACGALRRARRDGAQAVAREARELVRPLAMPALELEFTVTPDLDPEGLTVDGTPCRVTTRGADRVELAVRTNPGEAAGPALRIASGGERSRLWLGLSVLARRTLRETPLMLFDEVDAGLGMDHAVAVARLLAAVADGGQVLCITHLPTVAAQGDHHLRVRKEVRDGRAEVRVAPLAGEDRVAELARLLGGDAAGDAVHREDYARELLRGRAARA